MTHTPAVIVRRRGENHAKCLIGESAAVQTEKFLQVIGEKFAVTGGSSPINSVTKVSYLLCIFCNSEDGNDNDSDDLTYSSSFLLKHKAFPMSLHLSSSWAVFFTSLKVVIWCFLALFAELVFLLFIPV